MPYPKYNYRGSPLQGSGVYDDFLTDDTDGELLSSLLSRWLLKASLKVSYFLLTKMKIVKFTFLILV